MSDVHTCGYYCDRPRCIKEQRDELRDRFQIMQAQAEVDAKAQRKAQAQAQAVNQQLLEALLEHFVGARFAIDTNMKGTAMDCINEGIAAIAAAQEQNNSATAQED